MSAGFSRVVARVSVNNVYISHPAAALAVLAVCCIRCAAQLEACVEHRKRRPTDKLLSTSPRELLQCDVEEFNKCVLTCACFCCCCCCCRRQGFRRPCVLRCTVCAVSAELCCRVQRQREALGFDDPCGVRAPYVGGVADVPTTRGFECGRLLDCRGFALS